MPCPDQSLSKQYRLKKPSEFREVFSSRNRIADENFIVLYRRNELEYARLGTAISRKNVNLAIERNRIKRLIRESFRCQRDKLSGYDIVVVCKKNIHLKQNKTISHSLSRYWEKLESA